ncbi:MAG: DNA replication and repair protein RecF [Gemmatimonadetes bacterium]|nr:DNA replication and repair protein RecF [Gemmatimonadota bacterium]
MPPQSWGCPRRVQEAEKRWRVRVFPHLRRRWRPGPKNGKFSHAESAHLGGRLVHLSHLELRHFRNLGSQELEIPPQGLALVGDNAHGKSNFLEAIYYLETFRSFRGAPDEQLVELGEEVFLVAGTQGGEAARPRAVTAAYQKRGKRKKVTVDGAEPDRLGDALGSIAAVVFSPADVTLVSGGPTERRRYLDIVLSLNVPGYLRALQHFRHVLSQRNAALRDQSRSPELVRAWDDGLVRWGARVLCERRAWVEERCGAFRALYETVGGPGQSAALRYAPGVPLDGAGSEDDVAAAYRSALEASADRESRQGSTVVGPHRDDLVVSLDAAAGTLDARDFGSGGQWRTAALALRLVEARTIRDRRGRAPLMLVDDVFSELDEGRSERALALLEQEETGQVILTAPKQSDVRLRRDALPRWRIAAGRISA